MMLRTTSHSPPVQVPEPCVWHAPQRDHPTAELGSEGRPRGGDPDRRLQGLQGRHRAGGILAARGRDGTLDALTNTHNGYILFFFFSLEWMLERNRKLAELEFCSFCQVGIEKNQFSSVAAFSHCGQHFNPEFTKLLTLKVEY